MKKIFAIILSISLLIVLSINPVFANSSSHIEYLSDGSYFETVIYNSSDISIFNTKSNSKSGSKTAYYKNSSGVVQWYVRVTGEFTYNGTSSTCTSSVASAPSNVAAWKIASKSASKSGNSATAKATAKCYSNGVVVNTITKSVTLTCDKNGNLS